MSIKEIILKRGVIPIELFDQFTLDHILAMCIINSEFKKGHGFVKIKLEDMKEWFDIEELLWGPSVCVNITVIKPNYMLLLAYFVSRTPNVLHMFGNYSKDEYQEFLESVWKFAIENDAFILCKYVKSMGYEQHSPRLEDFKFRYGLN